MATPLLQNFDRVSKFAPCHVCSHPDWCMHGKPGTEFEGATLCKRVESPYKFGQAGFLHRPPGSRSRRFEQRDRVLSLGRSKPGDERMAKLAVAAEDALTQVSREALVALIDVHPYSLTRLGLGFVSGHLAEEHGVFWARDAWTFPMRNALGEVRGLRLRKRDGTKLTWPGGHDGLFLPDRLDATNELLVCEGPTDTAAALDLCFDAVGRPSCSGAKQEVIELVRLRKPARVVVVSDQDQPGRAGALELVRALITQVADVRLIVPPAQVKDLRAWKQAGATQADVRQAIDVAQPFRIKVVGRGGQV